VKAHPIFLSKESYEKIPDPGYTEGKRGRRIMDAKSGRRLARRGEGEKTLHKSGPRKGQLDNLYAGSLCLKELFQLP